MNAKQKSKLQHELRSVGATYEEIGRLVNIASSLGRLKSEHRQSLQPRHEWQHSKLKTLCMFAVSSLSSLAIGMMLIIFSQAVLPGNILYPLQRVSDTVSASVDHSYGGTVMMKRAEQVRQLISEHAPPGLVLTTLADYEIEASAYKHTASNYAAFEYCKNSLQEASTMALPAEKQAINTTLRSLNDV